jgi:hypothetical protein
MVLPSSHVPASASRLVPSPVFLLSPVRSGSTLMRVLLNSHSRIRAPHELHLRHVRVELDDHKATHEAMRELDLDQNELQLLLWDRIMHRELLRTRKTVFVDKTPQNLDQWKRLHRGWPQARYIFLMRHPASVLDSLNKAKLHPDPEAAERRILVLGERLNAARAKLKGHTVRYEDLTADPARVTREVCGYLGVPWERGMLSYGDHEHGEFKRGLGDFSENIRSGKVLPARALPSEDEVPPSLLGLARSWGYL